MILCRSPPSDLFSLKMSPTVPSLQLRLGGRRGETARGFSKAGTGETDRSSEPALPAPKPSSLPKRVRDSQWRFHLKPCLCVRARSIVSVNSCLGYCQQ